jgi:hypothetical protein
MTSVRMPPKRWTGARAGRVSSREIQSSGAPTPFPWSEGNTPCTVSARCMVALRGRRPRARSEPHSARTGRSAGLSPRWRGGTRREGHEPYADDARPAEVRRARSTDEVPERAGSPAEERAEGRSPAKGNTVEQNAPRTQSRKGAPSALDRVREAAKRFDARTQGKSRVR